MSKRLCRAANNKKLNLSGLNSFLVYLSIFTEIPDFIYTISEG